MSSWSCPAHILCSLIYSPYQPPKPTQTHCHHHGKGRISRGCSFTAVSSCTFDTTYFVTTAAAKKTVPLAPQHLRTKQACVSWTQPRKISVSNENSRTMVLARYASMVFWESRVHCSACVKSFHTRQVHQINIFDILQNKTCPIRSSFCLGLGY